MKSYAARQLEDGLWYWTCRDGTLIFKIPPCNEHAGHATQEEAERCYHAWELAGAITFTSTHRYPCHVCGERTDKHMATEHTVGYPLCDKHRTAEQFARLHTFSPGRRFTSS